MRIKSFLISIKFKKWDKKIFWNKNLSFFIQKNLIYFFLRKILIVDEIQDFWCAFWVLGNFVRKFNAFLKFETN